MNLSAALLINGIFALLGGIGLILMPESLLGPYDAVLGGGGIFVARLLGTVLLGVAIISLYARSLTDKHAKKVISIGFTVTHIGSALVGLQALVSGQLNSLLWVDIIAHGLLAAGFIYFLFQEPKN